MRVVVVLVLISLGFTTQGISQWAIPAQMRASNTLDRLATQNGFSRQSDLLYGLPMEPGTVVGDVYLAKSWNTATILLTDSEKTIEGYPVRYNIQDINLEINTQNGIKVLDSKRVKSMVWIDSLTRQPHYFVNASSYKEEGAPLSGLVEVLVDGEVPLLSKFYLEIVKPTYNVAMGSGSKDTKIYKRKVAYCLSAGSLIKIKTKKDVLAVSEKHSAEIASYISDNHLKANDQADLIQIFTKLNELLQAN